MRGLEVLLGRGASLVSGGAAVAAEGTAVQRFALQLNVFDLFWEQQGASEEVEMSRR